MTSQFSQRLARLATLATLVGSLSAGCTPDPGAEAAVAVAAGDVSSPSADASGPSEPAEPRDFAGTAWRVVSDEGARFTTYLDADGTYRDLRNGDAYQQGSWTWNADGESRELCFEPDAESGINRCWSPGQMDGDTMIVTGGENRRIEARRVDYIAPAVDEDEEDEAADEAPAA